jgi:hypothetical protein
VTRYEVIFDGILVPTDSDKVLASEDVETFVDLFAGELEEHHGEDIDVSTNLETHEITVSVTLEKDDLLEAQGVGSAIIRSAFHAAGAHTPGWEIDWIKARTVLEKDNHPELASA